PAFCRPESRATPENAPMTVKLKQLGNQARTTFNKLEAEVQQKIFDGPVGQKLAAPTGWVAKGAAKMGVTALKSAPPPPVLKRPVVMITGLTMQAASYDPLAKHLASNQANGQTAVYVVGDGKF